jgi:hypothetical protein
LVGFPPGAGPAPGALPAVLVVVPRWATAFAEPWEPPPPQAAATRARPHTTRVRSPPRQARPLRLVTTQVADFAGIAPKAPPMIPWHAF